MIAAVSVLNNQPTKLPPKKVALLSGVNRGIGYSPPANLAGLASAVKGMKVAVSYSPPGLSEVVTGIEVPALVIPRPTHGSISQSVLDLEEIRSPEYIDLAADTLQSLIDTTNDWGKVREASESMFLEGLDIASYDEALGIRDAVLETLVIENDLASIMDCDEPVAPVKGISPEEEPIEVALSKRSYDPEKKKVVSELQTVLSVPSLQEWLELNNPPTRKSGKLLYTDAATARSVSYAMTEVVEQFNVGDIRLGVTVRQQLVPVMTKDVAKILKLRCQHNKYHSLRAEGSANLAKESEKQVLVEPVTDNFSTELPFAEDVVKDIIVPDPPKVEVKTVSANDDQHVIAYHESVEAKRDDLAEFYVMKHELRALQSIKRRRLNRQFTQSMAGVGISMAIEKEQRDTATVPVTRAEKMSALQDSLQQRLSNPDEHEKLNRIYKRLEQRDKVMEAYKNEQKAESSRRHIIYTSYPKLSAEVNMRNVSLASDAAQAEKDRDLKYAVGLPQSELNRYKKYWDSASVGVQGLLFAQTLTNNYWSLHNHSPEIRESVKSCIKSTSSMFYTAGPDTRKVQQSKEVPTDGEVDRVYQKIVTAKTVDSVLDDNAARLSKELKSKVVDFNLVKNLGKQFVESSSGILLPPQPT